LQESIAAHTTRGEQHSVEILEKDRAVVLSYQFHWQIFTSTRQQRSQVLDAISVSNWDHVNRLAELGTITKSAGRLLEARWPECQPQFMQNVIFCMAGNWAESWNFTVYPTRM
jgi:hypothetical protein